VLVLLFSLAFGAVKWVSVTSPWPYWIIVVSGSGSLLAPAWFYRVRGGPSWTPLERQLGQVWCVVLAAIFLTGLSKWILLRGQWPAYPMILLQLGIGFGCTAAILGGSFYVMALMCWLLALFHVVYPETNPALSGLVFGVGLLVPGLRYSRRGKADTMPRR